MPVKVPMDDYRAYDMVVCPKFGEAEFEQVTDMGKSKWKISLLVKLYQGGIGY